MVGRTRSSGPGEIFSDKDNIFDKDKEKILDKIKDKLIVSETRTTSKILDKDKGHISCKSHICMCSRASSKSRIYTPGHPLTPSQVIFWWWW